MAFLMTAKQSAAGRCQAAGAQQQQQSDMDMYAFP